MIYGYLNEYTRKRLLTKSRTDTPARYKRRTDSGNDWTLVRVDTSELQSTGDLILSFRVKSYQVAVRILKYEPLLEQYRTGTYKNDIRKAIRKSVMYALNYNHLQVVCSCPDFKYRFAYMATKKGYGLGTNETRPAKITNPKNKGGMCKHLIKVLSIPSLWMPKVVTVLRGYVKANRKED